MTDWWVQNEWQELCRQLKVSAEHLAEGGTEKTAQIEGQVREFCSRDAPRRYRELLDRVREAARLAIDWQNDDSRQLPVSQSSNDFGDGGSLDDSASSSHSSSRRSVAM
jgi:hypothetical protein